MSAATTPSRSIPIADLESPVTGYNLLMNKDIVSEAEDEEEDATTIYLRMKERLAANRNDERDDTTVDTILPAASEVEASPPPSSTSSSRQKMIGRDNSEEESDSDIPIRRKHHRSTKIISEKDKASNNDTPSSSEEDSSDAHSSSSRFRQLVAQRRAERLAKGLEEKGAAEKRQVETAKSADKVENQDDIVEKAIDDDLTEQTRPSRKASKKALEDMERETQRMNRNMQLAHQAKTKKKFTMSDFAARFGKKKEEVETSSAQTSSDTDAQGKQDSPPTSPLMEKSQDIVDLGKSIFSMPTTSTANVVDVDDDDDEDLPTLEEAFEKMKQDMAKKQTTMKEDNGILKPRMTNTRIQALLAQSSDIRRDDDADDLEIVKVEHSIFDQVKPRTSSESHAFHNLRLLANMNNHDQATVDRSKRNKQSLTSGQLDALLLGRVSLQARQEREEKIARLKSKGIIVQSQDERERDQMEIEDMLERARIEAEELRRKEKEQAKAEGRETAASEDEDTDDEWEGEEREEQEENDEESDDQDPEGSLSGSEDEDAVDNEDAASIGMIDDAADENSDEESQIFENEVETTLVRSEKHKRRRLVLDDEEEEGEGQEESVDVNGHKTDLDFNKTDIVQSSQIPNMTVDKSPAQDIAAAFGFQLAAAPISHSQLFAGTMGASQGPDDSTPLQWKAQPHLMEQDSMDVFNAMVPILSTNHDMAATFDDDSQTGIVQASQPQVTSKPAPVLDVNFTQPFATPSNIGVSQYSTLPSPSQDVGFRNSPLTIKNMHSAHPLSQVSQQQITSTIDTIPLIAEASPSPVKRRTRLRRLKQVESDEENDTEVASHDKTAFGVMRQAAKEKKLREVANFDKLGSGAKNMVDEQAEESEDEYAGVGGASDDDDGGEANEADKAMIDESEIHVDERKIAAFFADKERKENEAQTSKLYKDLMSGGLRRPRGGDIFDLDSDEDEQLAERRRRRQREEARKRKLLLGDERLGKLGSNTKSEAFLRSLEDRDDDEEVDMLQEHVPDSQQVVPDSQQVVPDSQPKVTGQDDASQVLQSISSNVLKRKASDLIDIRPMKRSVTNLDRNSAFIKPVTHADVRESVSFLIDDPHGEMHDRLIPLSDEENDDQGHDNNKDNKDNDDDGDDDEDMDVISSQTVSTAQRMLDEVSNVSTTMTTERLPFSARRTPASNPTVQTNQVVNRLLLRQSTSNSITANPSSVAFLSRSSSSMTRRNVIPSLAKRNSTLNSNTRGVSELGNMGPPAPAGLIRQGSSSVTTSTSSSSGMHNNTNKGKRSSIHSAAREAERRAAVEKVELRRKEDVRRVLNSVRKSRTGGQMNIGIGMGMVSGGKNGFE